MSLRLTQHELHRQLLEIRAESGRLVPQDVVDAARDERHPLHSRFEWDDSVAGEGYRRIQAAELIRSVRVVYAESAEGEPRRVRAWSALPDRGPGYAPTEEIMHDPLASKVLLRQAERELKIFERKYGHLREFRDLIASVLNGDAA